jgi:hypothetical protein
MACRLEDGKIKNIKQIEFYTMHAAMGGCGGGGDVHENGGKQPSVAEDDSRTKQNSSTACLSICFSLFFICLLIIKPFIYIPFFWKFKY